MAVAVVVGLGLSGCSTMRSMQDSLFGGEEHPVEERAEARPDAAEPSVYYIGTGGAPLYREAGSTVLTHLAQYRKVHRFRLEKGYAFVRVDGSGEEGWVDNAKLIWRLPSARPAPPVPPAEPSPAEPAADVQAPEAAQPEAAALPEAPPPADAAPAPDTPPPTKVEPSVFDPY